MSSTWSQRERTAARALGVPRTLRARGESAPDTAPVQLADGTVLQPEVKHRKRLPLLLRAALEQARRYNPKAEPLVVVSERGGRQLAVLDLALFARLIGVQVPVATKTRRRRSPPSQPELFSEAGA